ncbi:nitroreductase [Virgibacillus xinjiangensis]|uniref:Nitroreductase n=1 Tax=Virgibacillus xinjiangensis TaxID=393090 RepID=A0ABV7CUJ7_9BACI
MGNIKLTDIVRGRRTILDYKPQKIDEKLLVDLFNDAAYAPNHHMKEPWRIRVYEEDSRSGFGEKIVDSYIRLGLLKTLDKEKLVKARKSYDRFFTTIPHHILFYMDKEDDGGHLDEENYAAVCAFIQNFQLLAWEKGIGTMWTAKETLRDEVFIHEIGLLPERHKLVAVVQAGYPNRVPKPRERTPLDDRVEWVRG